MVMAFLVGNFVSWLGSPAADDPVAKEEQRRRALAILDKQARPSPSSSPWPIVGWADSSPSASVSNSCRAEREAYDAWHQGLGPITSGLTSPARDELRGLKRDAEEYILVVAPLAAPAAKRLILALSSYKAIVVSEMVESHGIDGLQKLVTAGLVVNGEHLSYQASCGG
ncbi:hypothetical protein ACWCHM_04860 [Micromonospora sp. SCSIO 07396]